MRTSRTVVALIAVIVSFSTSFGVCLAAGKTDLPPDFVQDSHIDVRLPKSWAKTCRWADDMESTTTREAPVSIRVFTGKLERRSPVVVRWVVTNTGDRMISVISKAFGGEFDEDKNMLTVVAAVCPIVDLIFMNDFTYPPMTALPPGATVHLEWALDPGNAKRIRGTRHMQVRVVAGWGFGAGRDIRRVPSSPSRGFLDWQRVFISPSARLSRSN